MSYVIDAALAVEEPRRLPAHAAGTGSIPGQCRTALQGALPAGDLFLHARVPQLYGTSPLPQRGDTEFCVGSRQFLQQPTPAIAGAASARPCSPR